MEGMPWVRKSANWRPLSKSEGNSRSAMDLTMAWAWVMVMEKRGASAKGPLP